MYYSILRIHLIAAGMAIVVEQTIPFADSALDLENYSRWTSLLPLIRPSLKATTINNHVVLVDQSLASSKDVRIALVGRLGNFSSKLLESRHVCAVGFETNGKRKISARDISEAVSQGDLSLTPGLVIVRSGKRRNLDINDAAVEVEVDGDLEADHVLHLLGVANDETRYASSFRGP